MRWKLTLLSAGVAVLATSCMVGPDYETPKAKVAGTWMPGPALTNRPFSEAEVYWWRRLSDPDLNRLVETACSNNLSLQMIEAQIVEDIQPMIDYIRKSLKTEKTITKE